MDNDFYQSALSNRYGSAAMRRIWSEKEKRRLWRELWTALARAQAKGGIISWAEAREIADCHKDVDIERALAIEQDTRHDLVAELRVFAEQAGPAGNKIHLGATSSDIVDNVDIYRQRVAAAILAGKLRGVLVTLGAMIKETADWPTMGYTHLQPAEPTTVGYRLASYAQDLLVDYQDLMQINGELAYKGFGGAVGTQASFVDLFGNDDQPTIMEARAIAEFTNQPVNTGAWKIASVVTQTYPRKQDLYVMQVLASLAASLHRFAQDVRLLVGPLRSMAMQRSDGQVGSSTMPHKVNPIAAENICSLARYVGALQQVAWSNAATAMLERTLDDSANRRLFLPDAFIACDEMLAKTSLMLHDIVISKALAEETIQPLASVAKERMLNLLVARVVGIDRAETHDILAEASWLEAVGLASKYLLDEEIRNIQDMSSYLGTAPRRALQFADVLDAILKESEVIT